MNETIKISFNSIDLEQSEAEYIAQRAGWDGTPENLVAFVSNACALELAKFVAVPKNQQLSEQLNQQEERGHGINIQEKFEEIKDKDVVIVKAEPVVSSMGTSVTE